MRPVAAVLPRGISQTASRVSHRKGSQCPRHPRPIDPSAVKTAERQMLTPRNEKGMRALLDALSDLARITTRWTSPGLGGDPRLAV
jgi:hypothetical protein